MIYILLGLQEALKEMMYVKCWQVDPGCPSISTLVSAAVCITTTKLLLGVGPYPVSLNPQDTAWSAPRVGVDAGSPGVDRFTKERRKLLEVSTGEGRHESCARRAVCAVQRRQKSLGSVHLWAFGPRGQGRGSF